MTSILLNVDQLVRRFGGLVATDSVSLAVLEGEVHAVIGPNGAGKTTLVSQISGELTPTSGCIHFAGKDITHLSVAERARLGIARSCQVVSIFREFTVTENVALAVQSASGHSFHFWRGVADDASLRDPALAVLERVGLHKMADAPAESLSHGDKRLLELSIAMAMQPRLWILDEPMAGMGHAEGARLLEFLSTQRGKMTMLLIEHDMDAVFQLSDRITVLELGRVIATGTPEEVRRSPRVQAAYLGEGGV